MNDEVREAVQNWIRKAETDWTTVEILVASERCPMEAVCFHCQQHVEKLLKAVLTIHQIEAPRSHDIRRLAQMAEQFIPELDALMHSADILTSQAVEVRYPADVTAVESVDMEMVLAAAHEFRSRLLSHLDLTP